MRLMKLSIVILMYNSNWEKLKATVMSVVLQDIKEYEVVFADDGSKVKHNQELIKLMDKFNFTNYKFVDSPTNVGTVKNIYNALKHTSGDYVKLLSPGDLLFDNNTLARLLKYVENSNAEVVFGDAVYYNSDDGKISKLSVVNSPANLKLYDNKNSYYAKFVDCLLGNDGILGASILARSDVICYYISEMVDKVKYAEDTMIRIMMFDHRKIAHYQQPIIWYEYGCGISTGKIDKWSKFIKNDYNASDEIIRLCHAPQNLLEKRYIKYLTRNYGGLGIVHKIRKCIMFPSLIFFRLKMKRFPQYTCMQGDVEYVNSLYNYYMEA